MLNARTLGLLVSGGGLSRPPFWALSKRYGSIIQRRPNNANSFSFDVLISPFFCLLAR